MPKARIAIAGIALAALPLSSAAYQAIANVTFEWATHGAEIGWDKGFPGIVLGDISNTSYYVPQGNNSSAVYYNSDFATQEFFESTFCAAGLEAQYACRVAASPNDLSPVGDIGPGPAASGQLTVTDTTLTGILHVLPTSDEGAGPQPGTREATGFNVRPPYDGGPFKNVWYGVDTTATLEVNLSGTFTHSAWDITGGTVRFSDPGFQCAFADFSGVLCQPSTLAGGLSADGSNLSWGMDLDGGGPGTEVSEIEVRDGLNGNVIESISGVLANLHVDAHGNITTAMGETRRAFSRGACGTYIIYHQAINVVACGGLYASPLNVTGSVSIIPLPSAAWLLLSAFGVLGGLRVRRP